MDLTPGPGEDHAPEVIYQAAGQMLVHLGATENYEPDLFEWHHCAACPNADGPCACAGGPWPSSDVRAVLDLAYRAGREEAARDIEAVPWFDEGPYARDAAQIARGGSDG